MFTLSHSRIQQIIASLLICLLSACASTSNKPDPYREKSAQTIYEQGVENTNKERYAQAIKDFEALEARYPYGAYTDKGNLALIHAYYKKGETASALAAADRFIRLHPKHPNVDYAHYLKGLSNYDEYYSFVYRHLPLDRSKRDSKLAKQAFDDFKYLVDKFPSSTYAQDARQKMVHLRNQLAEHELHVAEYYMSKGAYLAAANRAGYIVNQFRQSTTVPKALITMIKAYQELGMTELADDALKTLRENFPDADETKSMSTS